jgi:glycosyltransferase involved in cell wall biosynthesis
MTSLTALVLTFNEEPNIERTLEQLRWVAEVVVIDSNSTDRTRDIASRFANVRVVSRPFTTHAEQWNYGLEQTGIATDWVLALDADFVLTDEAAREVAALSPPEAVAGYRASFTYCIDGQPLRSAVYPPVTVLYRRARAKYVQDGHTQRIRVDGLVLPLSSKIRHDDRKPLSRWIASQVRYMRLEADKLATAPSSSLSNVDRARKLIVVVPPLIFLRCLFVGGGILDGWAGLFYALQRAAAELILSLSLVERRVMGPRPGENSS